MPYTIHRHCLCLWHPGWTHMTGSWTISGYIVAHIFRQWTTVVSFWLGPGFAWTDSYYRNEVISFEEHLESYTPGHHSHPSGVLSYYQTHNTVTQSCLVKSIHKAKATVFYPTLSSILWYSNKAWGHKIVQFNVSCGVIRMCLIVIDCKCFTNLTLIHKSCTRFRLISMQAFMPT